jgi:hypothetical protein
MNKEPQNHELDLDNNEALDLFAEELPAQDQKHNLAAPMMSDTLSTLACECELSTFGCLSGTFAA